MHPALALKVDHKFGDAFIMTAYNKDTSGESEEATNANIANVIAYLKDVSVKLKPMKMLLLRKMLRQNMLKWKIVLKKQL